MNNSPPPIQPGDESTSIPTPHTATPSHWRSKISGIWILEITLIAVTFGLTVLLWDSKGYQLLILYLFFLPVVLASFFLGRYQGGILAFLCVINAGLVITMDFNQFWSGDSPMVVMIAVTVWGATLGLTAIIIGSLRDNLRTKMVETHEAHIGVIEVLSRYLQSANPNWPSRSKRVSDLCEEIAERLKLSKSEIGNIRIACLLVDVENIEITSRVIRKAIGEMESAGKEQQQTFYGSDLVHSIGEVVSGIMPLLLEQGNVDTEQATSESQIGAEIVRAARGFDLLMTKPWSEYSDRPFDALAEMQVDIEAHYHPHVIQAMESVVVARQTRIGDELLY